MVDNPDRLVYIAMIKYELKDRMQKARGFSVMNRKKILTVCVIVILTCVTLLIIYYECRKNQHTDVLRQITQGDFTSLKELDEEQLEYLNSIYERYQGTDRMQWIYADINNDGDPELIWQEKDCVADSQAHRILAVFAVTPEGCRRVLWDVNDMWEFYSYVNNKIVYFYSYLGVYDYYFYGVCEYDADWEHTVKKTYEVYNIYDLTEFDAKDFLSRFDWAKDADRINYEEGAVYYVIGTQMPDGNYTSVLLEREEWMEQFGNDIGIVNIMGQL